VPSTDLVLLRIDAISIDISELSYCQRKLVKYYVRKDDVTRLYSYWPIQSVKAAVLYQLANSSIWILC